MAASTTQKGRQAGLHAFNEIFLAQLLRMEAVCTEHYN